MEKFTGPVIDTIISLLIGLTPAALGAGVSLMYEKGLTWGDRFARLAVGVTVSWFTSRAVGAIWPWQPIDPFVLQGITFTMGMIAYKATPPFISSATQVVGGIPSAIAARFMPTKTETSADMKADQTEDSK